MNLILLMWSTIRTISNEKVIHYQNIISYISNNDVNMLSLCVTPWAKLNKNMLNNAKTTIYFRK